MNKLLVIVIGVVMCGVLAGCGSLNSQTSEAPSGVAYVSNPWVTCTNEDIDIYIGMSFAIPEGATDVEFRMARSIDMGEARFTLDGVKWNARISKATEFNDNTGLYYTWSEVKESSLAISSKLTISGEEKFYESDAEKVYAGMWFYEDSANKFMYSITASDNAAMPNAAKAKTVFEQS